jgi:hypothetical protein
MTYFSFGRLNSHLVRNTQAHHLLAPSPIVAPHYVGCTTAARFMHRRHHTHQAPLLPICLPQMPPTGIPTPSELLEPSASHPPRG